MSTTSPSSMTRRGFLLSSGITVAFSLLGQSRAYATAGGESEPIATTGTALPDDLQPFPYLDSWISLDALGNVTVYTGKAELGQGVMTALLQIGCEELDIPIEKAAIVTADTARTPDEGLTAASHSMQYGGPALRLAAANVRMLLVDQSAQLLNIAATKLQTTGQGQVETDDGRSLSYAEIAKTLSLHVAARADAPLRQPQQFRIMGKSTPRLDIPAKVSGGSAFVQDMRPEGMLHARVIRGPSVGTSLNLPTEAEIKAMPGLHTFIQNGDFAAVVCEREWDAIRIMRELLKSTFKRQSRPIPTGDIFGVLTKEPAQDYSILDVSRPTLPPTERLTSRFSRPWLSHGSIGPSCAIAQLDDGKMTIWSHSQGVFDVRRVVSDLLSMAIGDIRVIQVQGAGCYGQNGADDVAADAALIAAALPGHPIRLQWMREQEFGWEPLGAGMVTEVTAGLDAQKHIVEWKFDVWSPPHNTRPTSAGGVLVGQEISKPFAKPEAVPIPMPAGDGSRNSNPIYDLPNMNVNFHFIANAPLRSSALRSLGGHLNVFSIESMFDELAFKAGIDPLDLRLNHLNDTRARETMAAGAEIFGWRAREKVAKFHGFGMAFARYKNLGAYCAVFLELKADPDTGHLRIPRVHCAVDCGEIVNPNGIRNQIEGGVIQSLSWCTQEEMQRWPDRRGGYDWSSYPILRFEDIPQKITVDVLARPGDPFLGVAEAAQGPLSAAIANALADATGGLRFRDMPITPEKVRAAILDL